MKLYGKELKKMIDFFHFDDYNTVHIENALMRKVGNFNLSRERQTKLELS